MKLLPFLALTGAFACAPTLLCAEDSSNKKYSASLPSVGNPPAPKIIIEEINTPEIVGQRLLAFTALGSDGEESSDEDEQLGTICDNVITLPSNEDVGMGRTISINQSDLFKTQPHFNRLPTIPEEVLDENGSE